MDEAQLMHLRLRWSREEGFGAMCEARYIEEIEIEEQVNT
jgi:hypothetical protein